MVIFLVFNHVSDHKWSLHLCMLTQCHWVGGWFLKGGRKRRFCMHKHADPPHRGRVMSLSTLDVITPLALCIQNLFFPKSNKLTSIYRCLNNKLHTHWPIKWFCDPGNHEALYLQHLNPERTPKNKGRRWHSDTLVATCQKEQVCADESCCFPPPHLLQPAVDASAHRSTSFRIKDRNSACKNAFFFFFFFTLAFIIRMITPVATAFAQVIKCR